MIKIDARISLPKCVPALVDLYVGGNKVGNLNTHSLDNDQLEGLVELFRNQLVEYVKNTKQTEIKFRSAG